MLARLAAMRRCSVDTLRQRYDELQRKPAQPAAEAERMQVAGSHSPHSPNSLNSPNGLRWPVSYGQRWLVSYGLHGQRWPVSYGLSWPQTFGPMACTWRMIYDLAYIWGCGGFWGRWGHMIQAIVGLHRLPVIVVGHSL